MQSGFTQKAADALRLAARAARRMHSGYVGTEHILLGLLQEDTGVAARVLKDNGVENEKMEGLMEELLAPEQTVAVKDRDGYSPRARKVLDEAEALATRFGSELVGTEHLLLALIKEGENVGVRLLGSVGVSVAKIYAEVLASIGIDPNLAKEDLSLKNARKKNQPSMLEQYSTDLTAQAREGKLDPVVGRESQIQRMIQILSRRTKNNPCLIGEPGVGKTAVVEGLATRIVHGNVPYTVANKRILTLDLSGMVAGSKYRGEFEERIKRVIGEVKEADNVILFLDEVHTLIGAGGAEGAIDASNILKPSLARGEIQLIGATTIAEYRKYIEKDAALERRFAPVTVEEPTIQESIDILEGVAGKYEEHHRVTISKEAIEAAVKLSARYINDRNLPDKAIDLIDEASSAVRLKMVKAPDKLIQTEAQIKEYDTLMAQTLKAGDFAQAGELKKQQDKLISRYNRMQEQYDSTTRQQSFEVTENDIAEVVAMWTGVPVKKIAEKESERLLKLESILHKRVIGQKEAVVAVARAMRRGRVGLQDPNRPIASFLFLGPTGVGKTELSKALAEAMFGSEGALIRVDMSEYMEGHSVSKMIGSPPGYVGFEEGGQLAEKIRKNPYSVVLFDEIEKAHPDVFNVLLQVLDDGHITDSKGRKVSFKNTILIMTSNAGANRIIDPKNLGFRTDPSKEHEYEKMKSGVMEEIKRIFKPEFINRIDEIMVFHPLVKEDMKQIVTLLAGQLSKRCEAQMQIKLSLTPGCKEYIVEKYADYKMGARPLKRAIQSAIEDPLAEEILSGRIKQGDKVTVGVSNKQITFTVKE